MLITVRTLRQGWSKDVEVPAKCLVGELRVVCALAANISDSSRCNMVLRGAPLMDDTTLAPVKPGDTVLVASTPVEVTRSQGAGDGMRQRSGINASASRDEDWDEDTNGDDAPLNLTSVRLRVYIFLTRKIKLPGGVARVLVTTSKLQWAKLVAWIFTSQVCARGGHSIPFLIVTGFYLIFSNLGTRAPGEPSAYSIFNNFQELPGNFNAARVDDTIMRRN